jgi:predicted esterase
LVELLTRAGAEVTVEIENAGHALTDETLEHTRRWLAEKVK